MHKTDLPDDIRDCIETCWKCRTHCEKTLYHICLAEGGEHVRQDHVRLMADCIQICQAAADFMTRGSALSAAVCGACAEVCHACADSCENIGSEEMQECAQHCRDCAETCDEMSLSHGARAASSADENVIHL
jgi:hypothetical protein